MSVVLRAIIHTRVCLALCNIVQLNILKVILLNVDMLEFCMQNFFFFLSFRTYFVLIISSNKQSP